MRYLKLWWLYTVFATQIAFASRLGFIVFTFGKLLRFGLYIFFLYVLMMQKRTLAGYSLEQVIFFFATYNFIDTAAQFFLREVYRFRSQVVNGNFDGYLLKPMSPLFRALFGGSDVLDLSLLVISLAFIVFTLPNIPIGGFGIFFYILLILNALIIALAFHIFVVALGVVSTEVDNTLWMYRDITQMGRIPVDIYQQPVRNLITFIIPIGVMMTFPVKALMGLLTWQGIVLSCSIGFFVLALSLVFWQYALTQYSSASS